MAQWRFVATVMVEHQRQSLVVAGGRRILSTKSSARGPRPMGKTPSSRHDQQQQKWASTGVGKTSDLGLPYSQGLLTSPVHRVRSYAGQRASVVIDPPAPPPPGASAFIAPTLFGTRPPRLLLDGSMDGGAVFTKITGGQLLGTLLLPGARAGRAPRRLIRWPTAPRGGLRGRLVGRSPSRTRPSLGTTSGQVGARLASVHILVQATAATARLAHTKDNLPSAMVTPPGAGRLADRST